MTLQPHLTPEAAHLAEQERLVAELTEQLATQETEFATAGAEFANFRVEYLRRFAPLYAELDRLEAEITRGTSASDETERGQQISGEAELGTAASRAPLAEAESAAAAAPPAELKETFRQVAKAVHPDLAGDDEERERRTQVMAAVNDAYACGDAPALQRILDGETSRPEAIVGTDVASRLVRAIRKVAQIRARFTELVQLQQALEADPMWELFLRVREGWADGVDHLADVEADLRAEIASASARLAALREDQERRQRSARASSRFGAA